MICLFNNAGFPPPPPVPPLVISAASNEPQHEQMDFTPLAVRFDPSESGQRSSWASGGTTTSASGSPLEKDLFDAFPSVPQGMPVASTSPPGSSKMESPLPPTPTSSSSTETPVGEYHEANYLSPFRYEKNLPRSTTLPMGPRALNSRTSSG